jgi:hypothetical protein
MVTRIPVYVYMGMKKAGNPGGERERLIGKKWLENEKRGHLRNTFPSLGTGAGLKVGGNLLLCSNRVTTLPLPDAGLAEKTSG